MHEPGSHLVAQLDKLAAELEDARGHLDHLVVERREHVLSLIARVQADCKRLQKLVHPPAAKAVLAKHVAAAVSRQKPDEQPEPPARGTHAPAAKK